jgi:hypothetical protein
VETGADSAAVVDLQEAETDADWAVEADHQLGQEEDTQRMGVEEDAFVVDDVAAVVAADAFVAVGDAVVVEDHGAAVGLVHKREVVDRHLHWEVAVLHESHLVVAADLLHLERVVEDRHLPYYAVAVDRPVLIFPLVVARRHLPEEAE